MKLVLISTIFLYLIENSFQQDICSTPSCLRTAANFQANMDRAVNPCDDFYGFACGNFVKNADLPSYYPENSTFMIMGHNVDMKLKSLLETPYDSKAEKYYVKYLKDYYQTCMDTETIDKHKNTVLINILKAANLYNDYSDIDIGNSLVSIIKAGIFTDFLVDIHFSHDPTNTTRNILTVRPHLGGMLHNAYYKKGIENDVVKAEYNAMVKILSIIGYDEATAKSEMQKVQLFRSNLAKSAAFNDGSFKRMTLREFDESIPTINFKDVINRVMETTFTDDEPMVIYAPAYLSEMNKIITSHEKQTMAFQLISTTISMIVPFLTTDVRMAALEMDKVMTGIETERLREVSCVIEVAREFDIALSSYYILNEYAPAKKEKVTNIHGYIFDAFIKSIKNSNVFTENVKQAALKKAKKMKKLIIYPEEYLNENVIAEYYRDYVYPNSDNFLEKAISLFKLRFARKFKNIDRINDNNDYTLYGDTTEVYSDYVGVRNLFRTTDAFLREPLYVDGAPNYILFGSVGFPLGHEVTMSLDSNNIKRDENGNLISFMDAASTEKYNKNAQCIIDYYGKLSLNGMNIDGERTLAENMADIYGLNLAYEAYQQYASDYGLGERSLPNLPYSIDQMLFVSTANIFCTKSRDAYLRHFMEIDVHSPRSHRVNGMITHNSYFGKVFNCPIASPMNPANKCFLY